MLADFIEIWTCVNVFLKVLLYIGSKLIYQLVAACEKRADALLFGLYETNEKAFKLSAQKLLRAEGCIGFSDESSELFGMAQTVICKSEHLRKLLSHMLGYGDNSIVKEIHDRRIAFKADYDYSRRAFAVSAQIVECTGLVKAYLPFPHARLLSAVMHEYFTFQHVIELHKIVGFAFKAIVTSDRMLEYGYYLFYANYIFQWDLDVCHNISPSNYLCTKVHTKCKIIYCLRAMSVVI